MKRFLALLLSVALLLCMAACSKDSTESTPVSCSITVSELVGTARTLRFDGLSELLSIGSTISLGDSVITDRDSTATLTVDGTETSIVLSPSSEILFKTAVDSNGSTQIVIALKSGSIANSIDIALEESDVYEVCTGDMTMAIRGTDAYVSFTEKGTCVSLLTGKAYVLNHADGNVYTVPAGVQGYFNADSEPTFELIDTDSFGEYSSASSAMLAKVENENKDYALDFEATLRDSYLLSEVDYTFTADAPIEGTPTAKEALENSEDAVVTTTTTVSTTTTTTSETEAETTTEATTTTSSAAKTTTAKKTTTTAKKTTTTAKTTTATTAATTTATTATTTTTTAASSEATEATTTTTTTTAANTAEKYQITFTGLYYLNDSDEWVALTEYTLTSFEVTAGVSTAQTCQYNGENFVFTVNWNSTDYTEGESYTIYADSYPDTYGNVYTNASAVLIS